NNLALMRFLTSWLREFVELPDDDRTVAHDLTQAGVNVEGIATEDGESIFEAEITTNRPDAMNHYGVARECAAIYDKELKPLRANLPAANGQQPKAFSITIEDATGC